MTHQAIIAVALTVLSAGAQVFFGYRWFMRYERSLENFVGMVFALCVTLGIMGMAP